MTHSRWTPVLALLLAACARSDDRPPRAGTDSTAAVLTDAQVVGVLAAANGVDSASGALGSGSGADPRVRRFGAQLVADHSAAARAGADLAAREGITPGASPTSRRFAGDGERNRAALGRESGAEFDRVFVENEADYHAMMLHVLDDTLLPAARDTALRHHLRQVRPVVEAHLRQAQQLQRALTGGM